MRALRTVLVVSPTLSVAQAMAAAARLNNYAAVVVKDFHAAKSHLAMRPHLLITELKLGQYNGLHLALRAEAYGVPAVVVADASFRGEVEHLNVVWASPTSVMTGALQTLMLEVLQGRGAAHSEFSAYEGLDADESTTPTGRWYPPVVSPTHH